MARSQETFKYDHYRQVLTGALLLRVRISLTASSGSVLTDKFTDLRNCLLSFRQDRRKELPDMDHFAPYLQVHFYPSRLGPLSHTGGIIEQGFGRTDLNKQRRQPT